MRTDLAGQRVLITGASSGIGRSSARLLVAEGAQVFITGLASDDELAGVARDIGPASRVGYASVDARIPETIAGAASAAHDWLGDVDVLVNNAGIASQHAVVEHDIDLAETEMQINYFGMFRMTQAVLPGMLARGSGAVINVASTLWRVPGPSQANYSATKAAIAAFSASLRSEVSGRGLSVTVFSPGLTRTPMIDSLAVDSPFLLEPDVVAAHLVRAIRRRPAEYVTGVPYRALALSARLAPEPTRRLVSRFY